jgi:uncharacterized membrane protein YjdF
MNNTYNAIYKEFSETTKHTFFFNIIAIILIFSFILGQTNTNGISGSLLKLLIITLLSYSLYTSITASNKLFNIDNFFVNPNLQDIRTNYLLNLLLCSIIGILIIYVFFDIFI